MRTNRRKAYGNKTWLLWSLRLSKGASEDEIKKIIVSFQKIPSWYHKEPDVKKNSNSGILEAYEILSDPQKNALHMTNTGMQVQIQITVLVELVADLVDSADSLAAASVVGKISSTRSLEGEVVQSIPMRLVKVLICIIRSTYLLKKQFLA